MILKPNVKHSFLKFGFAFQEADNKYSRSRYLQPFEHMAPPEEPRFYDYSPREYCLDKVDT